METRLGKMENEARHAARMTGEMDAAVVLPGQPPGGRQAEPASATGGSAGVEGIKEMLGGGGSGTIVLDVDMQPLGVERLHAQPGPAIGRCRLNRIAQEACQCLAHLSR